MQIWNRITLYFNAMILFVFKSILFEIFSTMHASIKQSIRISFSRIFRFFSFSIRIFFFDIFAFIFCLQTLSKTFRHLLIYRLNHVKCFQNWKQWNIHETTLLKFCFFFVLFWENIDFFISKKLLFWKNQHVVCLFCSFIFFINR